MATALQVFCAFCALAFADAKSGQRLTGTLSGFRDRALVLYADDPAFSTVAASLTRSNSPTDSVGGISDDGVDFLRDLVHSPKTSRRSAPGAACPSTTAASEITMEAAINNITLWHSFPNTLGSLTISWSSDAMNEIMVVANHPISTQIPTLYVSGQGGKSFAQASIPGNQAIQHAYFSNHLNSNGYFNAYATPESNSTTSLYISTRAGQPGSWQAYRLTTGSLGTIGVHIDVLLPHPYNANYFIAATNVNYNGQAGYSMLYYGAVPSTTASSIHLVSLLSKPVTNAMWSTSERSSDVNTTIFAQRATTTTVVDALKVTVDISNPVGSVAPVVNMLPNGKNITDFTQMNEYLFLERYNTNAANTLFGTTELFVSSDNGNTTNLAMIPVNESERTNSFEVVNAASTEVVLAASHTKTRLQGSCVVNVNVAGATYNYSASRAIFSDVIPSSSPNVPMYFDPGNPLACNGTNTTMPPQGGPFVMVVRRGNCVFADKLQYALNLSANAVIVINNVPSTGTPHIYMVLPESQKSSEYSEIPMVLISLTEGTELLGNYSTNPMGTTVAITESAFSPTAIYSYTNLYVSGTSGYSFTRSLNNVEYTTVGGYEYVDMQPINSMSTGFIENSYAIASGTYVANPKYQKFSVISPNKGATWSPMAVGSLPLRLSLDIGYSRNGIPLPKSVQTTPGLVIANGYINGSTTLSVVVSRDGGVTWTQATFPDHAPTAPTGFYFSLLDHGSVIVLSQAKQLTNTIYYSLNEGQTFLPYYFLSASTILGNWTTSDGTTSWYCQPTNPTTVSCSCVRCQPDGNYYAYFKFVVTISDQYNTDFWTTAYPGASGQKYTAVYTSTGYDTNTVMWTPPSGSSITWTRTSGQTANVLGVIADPSATGTAAFMYWYQQPKTGVLGDYVGLRIDFRQLLGGTCQASDFEQWTVTGVNNTACYMGATETVQRRKQCSVCFNGKGTKETWASESCACRPTDYHCAFGYRRVNNVQAATYASANETCAPDNTVNNVSTVRAVLVPGDQCRGIDFSFTGGTPPPRTDGPTNNGSKKSSNAGTIAGVVVVVVVVIGFAVFWKMKIMKKPGGGYLAVAHAAVPNDDDTLETAPAYEDGGEANQGESVVDNDDDDEVLLDA
eukprot:m.1637851 g.1637851  ORF g.1637851 m.1637851 type:complete len:1130 (+) comp26258_c0_seq1:193-3582(+)